MKDFDFLRVISEGNSHERFLVKIQIFVTESHEKKNVEWVSGRIIK